MTMTTSCSNSTASVSRKSSKATATTTTATKNNKSKSNDNQLLVALVDPMVLGKDQALQQQQQEDEVYQPIRLTCPHSGQDKDYLVLWTHRSTGHVMELSCLDHETPTCSKRQFSSWFLGNTVVSNGKLYVMTCIDPLLFVLASNNKNNSQQQQQQQQQWQPLEQLWEGDNHNHHDYDIVWKLLDKTQLLHLYDTYEMEADELFYKFSPAKTLAWLETKRQRVQQVLLQQLVAQQARELAHDKSQGGAFAPDFCLASSSPAPSPVSTSESSSSTTPTFDIQDDGNSIPKDDNVNPSSTPPAVQPTQQHQDQANRESLQILCNYLSPEWQTKFLHHVQQDATTVLIHQEEPPVVKRLRHDEQLASLAMATPVDDDHSNAKVAPKKHAMTFGQKQLSKVNTKGMKTMASFFAPKQKSNK